MKIALINRSDSTGGAAVVTYRLMQALRQAGADARMVVLEKLTDDPNVISIASPLPDRYNFLAERWSIFLRNGRSRENLFKVDIANHGRPLHRHPWVRQADVIMIGWVNQGMLSLRGIASLCELGKPVIWAMHDMWPFTGICHHALQCHEYEHVCRQCQHLDSIKKVDLSTAVQSQKSKLYARHPGAIHFVAVSNWLADCARRSRLLRGEPLSVIPNAIDIEQFGYERIDSGDLTGKTVIAMGAARLDDPIKGFDMLIEASRLIPHEVAQRLHLLLYGNIRDPQLLGQLAIPYTHLGPVKGEKALNDIYRRADIVLSASYAESSGATLVEGMASGCTAVCTGQGGQPDIVDHLHTGYIATAPKQVDLPAAIAEGITWAAGNLRPRQQQHQATQKFAAPAIAQQYIELCTKLLSDR